MRGCLAAAGRDGLGRRTPHLSVRGSWALLLASGGARDRSGHFLRRQDPAGATRLEPTLAELLADPDLRAARPLWRPSPIGPRPFPARGLERRADQR